MCNKSLNKAFGEKLFNFMLLNFRCFVLCHATPLRSHGFEAMQSIIFEIGSVAQEELACAMRAKMKHLGRSYSTLCCSICGLLSPHTPVFTCIGGNAMHYA